MYSTYVCTDVCVYTSHTYVHTTECGKVLWSCEGDQSSQDLLPVGEVGTSGYLCPVAVNDSTHELRTRGGRGV